LRAQLTALTRDSAIYGVGHIATRLITFLLLPYYSYQLTPAEYGELNLYFLFIAITQTFFLYGLDVAYLRYFSLAKEENAQKRITGSTLILSAITTCLLTILILFSAQWLSPLVIHRPIHPEVVPNMLRLAAGILFFDTFATFPFILLRGIRKPTIFASVKLLNVGINVGLNIWLVSGLHLALAGVLWANMIASGLTFLVMLPILLRRCEFEIDKTMLKEMVVFGIPNVPTYLCVMIIELADRKIIEIYRGVEEAGLYSAGYKLGMFMAVVTGAFRFAWQPFFLSHADHEDAPQLFSRVLTYYLLVTGTIFIVLTLFLDSMIKTHWPAVGYLLDKRYWQGLSVVPIILLAHIFDGVYANLMVGVYLKKLTSRLPMVAGAAAIFTIIACIILVPSMGMMAAAWITLIAFLMEAILLWIIVRKHYFVPYEWSRIIKLFIAGGLVVSLASFIWTDIFWWRIVLFALFPVVLFVIGFFEKRELNAIRRALHLT
jgi:O-antigen/teichoic acid export membrane protein